MTSARTTMGKGLMFEQASSANGSAYTAALDTPETSWETILRRIEREPPVLLAISSLVAADTPRLTGVNVDHAQALAEATSNLPPILVHRDTMRVIDGMHRVNAARLNGRNQIRARYFDGTEEDAFLLAVEANVSHGLPLTLAERRAAAERIIRARPSLSDRAIAGSSGLAAKTVAAIRKRDVDDASLSDMRVGLDGRIRPLSSAEGRRKAGEFIAENPDASLRVIARESGISIGTARDVRERVRSGANPVPPAQRRANGAGPTADRGALADAQPPVADTRTILEGLRRDPSIRYTEAGRTMLQWLNLRVAAPGEWRNVVDGMPPHCGVLVARIARGCVAFWLEVAEEMERLEAVASSS